MKRSLMNLFGFKKKNLLNEAILTQQNFLQKLVELISKKPKLIGISSINSVDDIYSFLDKSYESSTEKRDNEYRNINGLNLSQKKHEFYVKYVADIEEKESKRLKAIEVKKSKGLKLSDSDMIENVFNVDEFNKQWNIVDRLSFKEKNLALEIFKVVKLKDILNISDVKIRKSAEEILINQLRNYMNVDGLGIEFRQILPLYDSIINHLNKKVDVLVDDIIMLADLYMKNLYKSASEEERSQIDLGNLDFGLIFDKTKFYHNFVRKYGIKKHDINDQNFCVKVFESDRVEIYFPKTTEMFNYVIRHFDGKVDWCTQGASTWNRYNQAHYLMIMHDKLETPDNERTKLVSLKVNFDGSIDYEASCDYYNDAMDETQIEDLIDDSDQLKIFNFINNNKSLFGTIKHNFLDKKEVSMTINGLLDINNIDYLKQYMYNSVNDEGMLLENIISIQILKKACEENNNIEIFVDVFNDIIADSYFLDINNRSVCFEEIYMLFDGEDELKNKLIFDLFEKSSRKNIHAKYFMLLYAIDDVDFDDIINNNLDLFNRSLKQVFNTNNTMIFYKCIEILCSLIKKVDIDYYDILYNSTGFIKFIKEDNFIDMFNNNSIYGLFKKDKEEIINSIRKYNENQEVKINIVDFERLIILKDLNDDITRNYFILNGNKIIESKHVVKNYNELFTNIKYETDSNFNYIKYNMFNDINIYNRYIKHLSVQLDKYHLYNRIYDLIKTIVFDKVFNNNESVKINEQVFKLIIKDFFEVLIRYHNYFTLDINDNLIYLKLFECLNDDIKLVLNEDNINLIYSIIINNKSHLSDDILFNAKYVKYFKYMFKIFNFDMFFNFINKFIKFDDKTVMLKIFNLVDDINTIKLFVNNKILSFRKQTHKAIFNIIELLFVLSNSKHSVILNEILSEILLSEILLSDIFSSKVFGDKGVSLIENLINNYFDMNDFNIILSSLDDAKIKIITDNYIAFNIIFDKIIDLFNKNTTSINKQILFKILLNCNNNLNKATIEKLLYNFIVLDSSKEVSKIKDFINQIFKMNKNDIIKIDFKEKIKLFLSQTNINNFDSYFINDNKTYLLKKYIRLLIN